MPLGRPIRANRKYERLIYELTVRFSDEVGAFLDTLDKGDRAQFVRDAVEEKIKREKV